MKYKKSETSIATILTAATRVLARQGYARTSLMDIAQEAGMSKGAVHYHFPTKESLISHVLEHACNAVAERASSAWQQSGGDPLQTIHAAVHMMWSMRIDRTEESAVVADLLAQSLHDEALRPQLAEYYRFATQQLAKYLAENVKNIGVQMRIPPEKVARILNGLLDGLVMQAFVDPEAIQEADVFTAVEALAQSFFVPVAK